MPSEVLEYDRVALDLETDMILQKYSKMRQLDHSAEWPAGLPHIGSRSSGAAVPMIRPASAHDQMK